MKKVQGEFQSVVRRTQLLQHKKDLEFINELLKKGSERGILDKDMEAEVQKPAGMSVDKLVKQYEGVMSQLDEELEGLDPLSYLTTEALLEKLSSMEAELKKTRPRLSEFTNMDAVIAQQRAIMADIQGRLALQTR